MVQNFGLRLGALGLELGMGLWLRLGLGMGLGLGLKLGLAIGIGLEQGPQGFDESFGPAVVVLSLIHI